MLLFTYAAFSKLHDYEKFVVQLSQSPLLTAFAKVYAILIPLLELVIVALLYFTRTRLSGLYASYAMMVLFTAYIIVITNLSEFIPCSCGGILSKMTWKIHLYFNLGFVLLNLAGILLAESPGHRTSTIRG
jgi:hypothetical protein